MASQTVAAVFDSYDAAAAAVSQLESAGVAHSDVSIVSNDAAQRSRYEGTGAAAAQNASTGAGTGATVGTAVGAGAGVLAGLGMLAIPGLGPVVAAGWLVSALVGAGAGAAAGGLLGSLAGAGVNETDARGYAEAVNRGGTLVTVRATEANHASVVQILDQAGAVDMDQRESSWRSEGWTGGATERARTGASDVASSAGAELGLTEPNRDRSIISAPNPAGPVGPSDRARVRSYPGR